ARSATAPDAPRRPRPTRRVPPRPVRRRWRPWRPPGGGPIRGRLRGTGRRVVTGGEERAGRGVDPAEAAAQCRSGPAATRRCVPPDHGPPARPRRVDPAPGPGSRGGGRRNGWFAGQPRRVPQLGGAVEALPWQVQVRPPEMPIRRGLPVDRPPQVQVL